MALSPRNNVAATTALAIILTFAMFSLATGHRPKFITSAFTTLRSKLTMSSSSGMPTLPSNVVKYSQVPADSKPPFTSTKIPRGLLKDHSTKEGTWGVIDVRKGTLEYTIMEPSVQVFELKAPTRAGIIQPTVLHHVKALTDDLEFVVEFYRLPGTGPVDEKRE
mmetsp:Transcript_32233/g.46979  ORF Transcript_32233/g.46979 Transcript_32233/m.46979 type:complete len:164 (+) Transcript_32233:91-582(+)